jgi:hypothetical protein
VSSCCPSARRVQERAIPSPNRSGALPTRVSLTIRCVVCDEPAYSRARRLCRKHDARLRRTGSTDEPDRRRKSGDDPRVRFWTKVDQSAGLGGCWPWLGGRVKSTARYGSFGVRSGTSVRAHRFAYEFLYGPIPEGLTIDHLCMRPECVNPLHLEAVPLRENIARYWNARRASKASGV